MADGAAIRAGTAGGTINVVTDEITSPYSGSLEQAQGLKIIDGAPNGTAALTVTSNHEVLTFQANSGTVSVTGTPNVHVTNSATVTLTGTNPTFQTNSGTVVQGTDPWVVSGTVSLGGAGTQLTHQTNNGTVTLTGTNPVFVTNNGTVNGGTILGHMGTVHANIANNGTVTLTGTNPVFITNNGTVNGGTLLGHMGTVHANIANNGTVTLTGTNPVFVTNSGTVSVTGTPNVHLTNSSTVIQGTNPWLVTAWVNSAGTVSVTGTPNVHVTNSATVTATNLDIRDLAYATDSITMGSAITGLGSTLKGTIILLTASGTVIPLVSAKKIKVFAERYTVQGGTVTITVLDNATPTSAGTIIGPMQFSPTGGLTQSNPHFSPLYESPAGSAIYFSLAGSGTVGGHIRWFEEA